MAASDRWTGRVITALIATLSFILIWTADPFSGPYAGESQILRSGSSSAADVVRGSVVLQREDVLDALILPQQRNIEGSLDNITQRVRTPSILRRDFTCGPGKPCTNGACCGVSGFCGYGPTYCGDGCLSNCGASAECGALSNPPGKTCPLNTCCSKWGFCGVSTEFCGADCQSNCVLHPAPPVQRTSNVLNKVIGYYESWAQRLACHTVQPTDLPLDGLTHLNYAFAFLDPSSFELVTMNPQTPTSSFSDFVNLKNYKSSLQLFVSVGGWTFSDNGTATQPILGNIGRSSASRQTFAKNVLKFLVQYGFDGIDIDWEYPGAPDRGGQPEDVPNFVLILQTLRETFRNAGRNYGITLTLPSSFWYLRWFDVPGLLQYCDWVNLMSYDLHGLWDRNNPIGTIVQGHTNLTEIQAATELLWRVGVDPGKVNLGVGFYGRSFELMDPSCSTPGCGFSSGAPSGPCSNEGGILMYYEIQNLLQQHPELTPVHDTAAAVKYVKYDDNKWVSYDDADTFKSKIEWANSIGLGGLLIWASDTDDSKYSAMTGLLGRQVQHPNLVQAATSGANQHITNAQNLRRNSAQDCTIIKRCMAKADLKCPTGGWTYLGYEYDGTCKTQKGRDDRYNPICCPAAAAPKSCTWRGNGGLCNGQCHAGEVKISLGSWGGSPRESGANEKQCGSGAKALCCEGAEWTALTSKCAWSKCGQSCDRQFMNEVAQRYNSLDCTVFNPIQKYCCPDLPFQNCTWRGSQPDCQDAKCLSAEVAIDTHEQGRGYPSCSWNRKKTLCCQARPDPVERLRCGYDGDILLPEGDLEERARKPPLDFGFLRPGFIRQQRTYPRRGDWFRNARQTLVSGFRSWIRRSRDQSAEYCPVVRVDELPLTIGVGGVPIAEPNTNVEHITEPHVFPKLIERARNRVLSNGQRTRNPSPNTAWWDRVMTDDNAFPTSMPINNVNPQHLGNMIDRLLELAGSNYHVEPLILVEPRLNLYKTQVWQQNSLAELNSFRSELRRFVDMSRTLTERDAAMQNLWAALRGGLQSIAYLQVPDIAAIFVRQQEDFIEQWRLLATLHPNEPGAASLPALWREIFEDFLGEMERHVVAWTNDRLAEIEHEISPVTRTNAQLPQIDRRGSMEAMIRQLRDLLATFTFPRIP